MCIHCLGIKKTSINISNYIFFFIVFLSQNSMIVFSSATIYNLKGVSLQGARRTGGVDIYSLIFSNASCFFAPHKFRFIFQPEYVGKRNHFSRQACNKPPQISLNFLDGLCSLRIVLYAFMMNNKAQ